MHNTVPQMGRWNSSLGCMVYDETPQMGSYGSMSGVNINDLFKKAVNNLGDSFDKLVKTAPELAKQTLYSTVLKDPSVQQEIVKNADATLLERLQSGATYYVTEGYETVKRNPWTTLAIVAGVTVAFGAVIYFAGRGISRPARSSAPSGLALQNPRRKRKYKKLHRRRK